MQSKMANPEDLGSTERSNLRPGFDTAIYSETSQILQHSLFQNSPTMARLLIWLLHETLAGRGDRVKSYTIAVEALGRPENFDSQIDSYPRVQMGRLRKTLENYYAQRGPLRELCVYLQPGSYRLRLAKLDLAYPKLYRPLSREPATASAEENEATVTPQVADTASRKSGMTELPTAMLIMILVCLAALAALAFISML